MNFVTPRAAAKHELKLDEPATAGSFSINRQCTWALSTRRRNKNNEQNIVDVIKNRFHLNIT